MSYSQFRLEDIEDKLQLTIQECQTLVPKIICLLYTSDAAEKA